jgi:thiol:disulfide interchange protein
MRWFQILAAVARSLVTRHPIAPHAVFGLSTALALTLVLASAPRAQGFGGGIAGQKLSLIAVSVDPSEALPGEPVDVTLTLEIVPGYHVYGSASDPDFGAPVTAELTSGLKADGAADVPAGKPHSLGGIETHWIKGRFEITLPASVPADAAAGELKFAGVVPYSACDDSSCDPAATLEFSGTLTVLEGEAVAAAVDGPPAQDAAPDPVHIEGIEFDAVGKVDGERRIVARLRVRIDEGWHVYGSASDPANGEPFVWKTETGALEPAGEPTTPPGKKHEAYGLVTHWLDGRFAVEQQLVVPAGVKIGDSVELRSKATFMACDDSSCLASEERTLDVATFTLTEEVAAVLEEAKAIGEGDDDPFSSLWKLIGTAVLAGLLALTMPCTYPMIPVTFSFFLKQAETRNGSVLGLALTYGAGIIVMFALIGVTLGPVINLVAGHWITNLIFGLVFVLFSLVLFGAIDLQPPSWLLNASSKATRGGGLFGVFLMGAVLVVTTFTCTGPLLGSVLFVASSGDASLGLVALAMAIFGLTMAIPFVALGLVPGRIKSLPRSGEWMHVVKVTLGFVELAAALKFLSNADIDQQTELLPRELFLWLWAGLFGLAALFLFNLIKVEGEKAERIGPGRLATATAFALFAIYFAHGAQGARLDPVTTSILPPYSARPDGIALAFTGRTAAATKTSKAAEGSAGESTTPWTMVEDDFEKARALADEQNKLLLVNFTGIACVSCRQVENSVFPQPDITALLREHFVEARIHRERMEEGTTDWALREELVRSYTTPAYLAIAPSGIEDRDSLGLMTLKNTFPYWHDDMRAFLESAVAKAGRARPGK